MKTKFVYFIFLKFVLGVGTEATNLRGKKKKKESKKKN